MLDLDVELLFDREQEVAAIALELKGEQVVGEQPVRMLRRPRADPEPVRIRPRDVPEQRGARVRHPRAQRRRHEGQVVVLDEDRGVRDPDFFADRRGETRVDVAIRGPVLGAKLRTHVNEMTERPEPLVGEPVVVRGEGRLLEPEPAQLVRRALRRHEHSVRLVDDLAIGRPGAVRHPDPVALAHQRVECDSHATGRGRRHDAAALVLAMEIRLAIGDHDQRSPRRRREVTAAGQPIAEEQRTEQLVNRDERDEQRLDPRPPVHELRRHERGEAERDAGLRDEAGPDVVADGSVDSRGAHAQRHPSLMNSSRSADNAMTMTPLSASTSSRSDVPTATKKITSTGSAVP